jgi:hypothetical protein
MNGSALKADLSKYVQIPHFGVFIDRRTVALKASVEKVQELIWSLGGDRGWLAMHWAWSMRGFIVKLVGGTGLRRGRTHANKLKTGDALDFWRVLLADQENHRLLLYAEMKMPGEAWLEFKIVSEEGKACLEQTATFRPNGIWGRVYWTALYPFHALIFHQLASKIANG